jgi:hypothetical protein
MSERLFLFGHIYRTEEGKWLLGWGVGLMKDWVDDDTGSETGLYDVLQLGRRI